MMAGWGLGRSTQLIIALASVACVEAGLDGRSGAGASSDSAGVLVVHNDSPKSSASWQVTSSPSLQVGAEGTGILLDRVVSAARLPDGRVVILNGNPIGALIADRNGQLVRRIARSGGGPGEFRRPVALGTDASSRLTISDGDFGPTYTFDTLGVVVDQHHIDLERLQGALGTGALAESRIPLHGRRILVPSGHRAREPVTAGWQARWGRRNWVFVDSSYRRFDAGSYNYGITAARAGGMLVAPLLFHLSHIASSADPFRLWISDAREYRIDVRDSTGRLVRSIRKVHSPQGIDDTTLARLEEEVGGQYRQLPPDEYRAATAVLPDRSIYPVILGLLVDREGMLWVRETFRGWSVFDSSGTWVTSLEIPMHKVFEIGPDYVLGLVLDPDGAESVVELPLRRGSAR